MKSFDQIYSHAAKRKGGDAALQSLLPGIKSLADINALSDDRILSMMTKCIFQAGFSWKVVEKKWPEFEIVFHQFNPKSLEFLSPDDLESLVKDERIIRNMQKIITVPKNAQWINEVADEHGSFARFLSQWPLEELTGLFLLLKKRGARLGGNTGQRFLRLAGVDGFVLTRDVLLALSDAKIEFSGNATSKRDLKLIQSAFNTWHQETGIPYTHLSKLLAYSAGDNIVFE